MDKVLELQHQSFQWIFRLTSFRIDWFYFFLRRSALHIGLSKFRSSWPPGLGIFLELELFNSFFCMFTVYSFWNLCYSGIRPPGSDFQFSYQFSIFHHIFQSNLWIKNSLCYFSVSERPLSLFFFWIFFIAFCSYFMNSVPKFLISLKILMILSVVYFS